jgi:hypothetical protein
MMANKVTGANAGELAHVRIQAPRAARIAQSCRYTDK